MLFKLYMISAKLKIAKELSYRADFISGTITSILYALVGPLTQYLIFTNTNGFPGWTIEQVLLFQGVVLLFFGIRDMMFGEIQTTIMDLVWNGEFDTFLLKPFSTSGVLLTSGFRFSNISTVITGLIITTYYCFVCGVRIGLIQAFVLIAAFVSSLIFYMALILLCSAVVISFVKVSRITEIVEALLRFSQYPIQILPPALRIAFLIVFPLAIFAYVPVQVLLNRLEPIACIGFLSCIVIFYLSNRIFYFSIGKYTSAGG